MLRPHRLPLALPLAFLLGACQGGAEVSSSNTGEAASGQAEAAETPSAPDVEEPAEGAGTELAAESYGAGFDWASLDEAAWRERLEPEEFRVLREAGTERAGTGDLLDEKRAGTFTCAGCGLGVFGSASKYESGTGWPSFWEPLNAGSLGEDTDYKIGYARTEVHCARCSGHLGHVFPDGPEPTGLRYCINSVALDFEPAE